MRSYLFDNVCGSIFGPLIAENRRVNQFYFTQVVYTYQNELHLGYSTCTKTCNFTCIKAFLSSSVFRDNPELKKMKLTAEK